MSITISLSGEAKCSLKIPDDLLYTLQVPMMTLFVQSNEALWETIACFVCTFIWCYVSR